MNEKSIDPLTHDHFARFGSIIHSFARIELLIQSLMSRVAHLTEDMDQEKINVLTKALTCSQKRDALISYMELFSTPEPMKTEVRSLIDRAQAHNALRNHIAHSLWRHGDRPKSIKPAFLDLRQGKGHLGGYDDKEKDYTLRELSEAANDLMAARSAIIQWLNHHDAA